MRDGCSIWTAILLAAMQATLAVLEGRREMPITLSMNQAAEHSRQGSAEWMQARCGKITASRIRDVMDYTVKKVEGSDRRKYRIELLAERLTGDTADHFPTRDMVWGTEHEDAAREEYDKTTTLRVHQVGFIVHPTMSFAGASPDALVGHEGGLEIKCPRTSTHVEWMLEGVVPEEHRDQMQWGMACCGRQWWDFVSYDPRLPEKVRLFVVRLLRDEQRIQEISAEVQRFHEEIQQLIRKLGMEAS